MGPHTASGSSSALGKLVRDREECVMAAGGLTINGALVATPQTTNEGITPTKFPPGKN